MEARVLSLGYSILFGLLLSEGKTLLFFKWFYLSSVVSPIWAVVIRR